MRAALLCALLAPLVVAGSAPPAPVVHVVPYGTPTLPQYPGELERVVMECAPTSVVEFALSARFDQGYYWFSGRHDLLVTVDSPAFTSIDHPQRIADWRVYYGFDGVAEEGGASESRHLSELTHGNVTNVGGWHAGQFEGTGSVPLTWDAASAFQYRTPAGELVGVPRAAANPAGLSLQVTYYPAP